MYSFPFIFDMCMSISLNPTQEIHLIRLLQHQQEASKIFCRIFVHLRIFKRTKMKLAKSFTKEYNRHTHTKTVQGLSKLGFRLYTNTPFSYCHNFLRVSYTSMLQWKCLFFFMSPLSMTFF